MNNHEHLMLIYEILCNAAPKENFVKKKFKIEAESKSKHLQSDQL